MKVGKKAYGTKGLIETHLASKCSPPTIDNSMDHVTRFVSRYSLIYGFIQTQLSDSGKRLIVITTVVIIGRKVKDNSAFSTRTRCFKNIAIKMLVLNTASFWQDRYTFGYQNCTGAVHFWQGRYTFGDQKCTGAVQIW